MLNYRKIYKRFVKIIEEELEMHRTCPNMEDTERMRLLDEIERRYAISVLETILSWARELEGKECLMANFNQKDFKKWKKSIQIKKKV